MRLSCNGCRVLRKGCSESCSIRPCLQWIKSPEAQSNATVFLAKFYGRAGLLNLISAAGAAGSGTAEEQAQGSPAAIFRSLLYEACGRIVNPIYGSVGLLWSGKWNLCQQAVEAVLKGQPIRVSSSDADGSSTLLIDPPPHPHHKAYDIRHVDHKQQAQRKKRKSSSSPSDGADGAGDSSSSAAAAAAASACNNNEVQKKKPNKQQEHPVTQDQDQDVHHPSAASSSSIHHVEEEDDDTDDHHCHHLDSDGDDDATGSHVSQAEADADADQEDKEQEQQLGLDLTLGFAPMPMPMPMPASPSAGHRDNAAAAAGEPAGFVGFRFL